MGNSRKRNSVVAIMRWWTFVLKWSINYLKKNTDRMKSSQQVWCLTIFFSDLSTASTWYKERFALMLIQKRRTHKTESTPSPLNNKTTPISEELPNFLCGEAWCWKGIWSRISVPLLCVIVWFRLVREWSCAFAVFDLAETQETQTKQAPKYNRHLSGEKPLS